MNRSITRGLAVSAVSALTVSGLSFLMVPAASAAPPDVDLLSQFTGFAALPFDGTGSGSRLTAQLDAPGADVTFQVNSDPEAGDADPGWRDFAGTPQLVGRYAFVDWSGTDISGRSYVGERVALRATAISADGTSHSTRNNVEVTGDSSVPSVSITTSAAPAFTQPYVDSGRTSTTIPVSGSSSASSGTVELSAWRNDEGAFAGQTSAQVEPAPLKIPGTSEFDFTGRFTGAVDITAFDVAEGVVAIAAERGGDDVAPISLNPQTIGSISASFARAVPAGDQGDVSVRVADSEGVPVIGAEVRRLSDRSLVGYTDRSGLVVTTQAGGSTEEYYANATDDDAYGAADGDVQSGPVTVETYEPVAAYVDGILGDGVVFDVDEYDAGDLAVRVLDEQGRPAGAGESVSYRIYPSDEEAPTVYSTAVTNDDGVAVATFESAEATGSYNFAFVLTSQVGTTADQVRTFTTGEAAVLLSPKADTVVATAGGQIDYFGRLLVEGEPLPGRRVELAYERGVEVVPGNRPDAAIVTDDGRRLATSLTTNGNGSFRVTVDDSAERPQATERNGRLTAATGDTTATDDSTIDGNAGAGATSTTRFGSGGRGVADVRLTGFGNGPRNDSLEVAGPTTLAGESIKVFRIKANGKRLLVSTRTLGRSGDQTRIRVTDHNRSEGTSYVVRLLASQRVQATDSNTKVLR